MSCRRTFCWDDNLRKDEQMQNQYFYFDPEFSEYNPLFREIEEIREEAEGKNRGFIPKLIAKLVAPIIVHTD